MHQPEALGWFEWNGFVDVHHRRRRWERDGYVGADSTALAAVLDDGPEIGIVSWRALNRSGPPGVCCEIGVALIPEHRGQGLGTVTHRVLVDHMLRFTAAHRLEASVESGNTAEERTLERVGFQREGVLREVAFREGAWRDAVIYGLLRTDTIESGQIAVSTTPTW